MQKQNGSNFLAQVSEYANLYLIVASLASVWVFGVPTVYGQDTPDTEDNNIDSMSMNVSTCAPGVNCSSAINNGQNGLINNGSTGNTLSGSVSNNEQGGIINNGSVGNTVSGAAPNASPDGTITKGSTGNTVSGAPPAGVNQKPTAGTGTGIAPIAGGPVGHR